MSPLWQRRWDGTVVRVRARHQVEVPHPILHRTNSLFTEENLGPESGEYSKTQIERSGAELQSEDVEERQVAKDC